MHYCSMVPMLLLVTCLTSYAQEATLANAVKHFSAQLQPVKSANAQFAQRVDVLKSAHHLKLTVAQTDNKGKVKEEVYQFNLVDIDPATIAYKIDKDIITVTAEARKDQKYIRYAENGIWKSFTDRLKLYGDNPDAARLLVDALKKAVTLAEKEHQPTLLPSTYEGLALWLKANIENEVIGSDSYSQSLLFDGQYPLRATFQRGTADAKGTKKDEEAFVFNIADLSEKDVKLTTKGDYIRLALTTQKKQKYIRNTTANKKDDNVSEFEIVSVNPDRIRDIERAWRSLIPLAEKQLLAQAPTLQTLADAQKQIMAGVKLVKDGNESLEQAIKADCACTLIQKPTSGRNATEETYQFNLDDLSEKGSKLTVSGGLFKLTLKTQDNQRIINYYKNGTRQNYVSEIEIMADDLERFRYLPQAFEKAILSCRQARKSPVPVGSSTATLAWLTKQMPNLQNSNEAFRLTLTIVESNGCRLQLTEQLTGRTITETRYELPLKNLDAASSTFSVNGKNVFVSLLTTNKEKLIKTQKDGKPSDYTNTVRLQIDDLDKARNVTEAFRQLIKSCP